MCNLVSFKSEYTVYFFFISFIESVCVLACGKFLRFCCPHTDTLHTWPKAFFIKVRLPYRICAFELLVLKNKNGGTKFLFDSVQVLNFDAFF